MRQFYTTQLNSILVDSYKQMIRTSRDGQEITRTLTLTMATLRVEIRYFSWAHWSELVLLSWAEWNLGRYEHASARRARAHARARHYDSVLQAIYRLTYF